jgi:hypothetical protein
MTMIVDPAAMRLAIPAVQELIQLLDASAAALCGVDVPAGVPAGVAAQVAHVRHGAQRLRSAARRLDQIPDQLLRRISAAQLADSQALQAAGWTLPLLQRFVDSFSIMSLDRWAAGGIAAREVFSMLLWGEPIGVRGGIAYGSVPRRVWLAWQSISAAAVDASNARPNGLPVTANQWLERGSRGLGVASAGVTAVQNFSNPNLSTSQKFTRTGASVATGAGASALATAATAAAFGSAVPVAGTLGGFVGGMAWSFVDSKLHISDRIGDALAEPVEDAAEAAGDFASGAYNAGKDVVSDVAGVADDALGALGL